jgi:hypothetical protein
MPENELPPIDFVAFISSLAATALLHLGEKLAPDQPDGDKDIPAAKQMIDLLELLKEKTKGNLTEGESDVLENLLYNLRVRYLKETGR